ncbi:MAG TPA: hypothetical protein VHB27_18780 [Rhodopila sp.]|nr:hypothetical protein [Rhodopila sp.]
MSILDLPPAFLRTILHYIAVHLLKGADGNMDEAWQAAGDLMRGHDPQTEQEFRLCALLITFNLQAGEALAQAVNPNLTINQVMRLRSGALALTRAADRTERRLQQVRAARHAEVDRIANARDAAERPARKAEPPAKPKTATAPAGMAAGPGGDLSGMTAALPADIEAIMDAAEKDPTVTAEVQEITDYATAMGLDWNEAFKQFQEARLAAERAAARAEVAAGL